MSPTMRSANAKLKTKQLNAFRSSFRLSLQTAQQIRKFGGTVKKNKKIEITVVKNDSDVGGGTSEQSFSKSAMTAFALSFFSNIQRYCFRELRTSWNKSRRLGGKFRKTMTQALQPTEHISCRLYC